MQADLLQTGMHLKSHESQMRGGWRQEAKAVWDGAGVIKASLAIGLCT